MDPLELLRKKIEDLDLWEKCLQLDRNEYLKVSGSTDTNLYYISSGSLRIFVIDEAEEHTIRFAYSGNFIAALDSYITEKPSDLYIQALKKTGLKVISKKAYEDFIAGSEENQHLWNGILQQLVFQQMERERDLLTSSPQERYKRVLERSPRLFREIPSKYIASYLRMTPETFSRIKKS